MNEVLLWKVGGEYPEGIDKDNRYVKAAEEEAEYREEDYCYYIPAYKAVGTVAELEDLEDALYVLRGSLLGGADVFITCHKDLWAELTKAVPSGRERRLH